MLMNTVKKIERVKQLSKEFVDTNVDGECSWGYSDYQPSWHLFLDEITKVHPELIKVVYRYTYILLNYFHEYRAYKRHLIKLERRKENNSPLL